MQFSLDINAQPNIFLPYKTHGRKYHLLFSRRVPKKKIVAVKNCDSIACDTFFHIGEMTQSSYTGEPCGFIFYTTYPVNCQAGSVMAYSRRWAQDINSSKNSLIPFGVELVLKHEFFYLYHKKNHVTLVVNPNLASRIRENLEI